MTFRRSLRVLSLSVIVALCVKSRLVLMPFVDRGPYTRELNGFPDRQWPLYPRFLEGVRAHTKPGDTIAIVTPAMVWDDGYSYAYYRASYFLAGREVLPLVSPENEKLTQNFRDARYIATFGMLVRVPADIVWQGEGGMLLRPNWRVGGVPSSGTSRNPSRPPAPRRNQVLQR